MLESPRSGLLELPFDSRAPATDKPPAAPNYQNHNPKPQTHYYPNPKSHNPKPQTHYYPNPKPQTHNYPNPKSHNPEPQTVERAAFRVSDPGLGQKPPKSNTSF